MNSLPNPDSWIGRSIGDSQRYRLDKRLGGGGMGDVFLALDTRLGQYVALKLLKDTLVASQEMRKRFEREVEICTALQSNYIVKVTDYGVTEEGFPFYVMEYLRGKTLRQVLLQEKRLSVERTVRIITQICKGLQLAHKGVILLREGATKSELIQVVHRDLKPDNIFLVSTDSEELVKILDFGIAKIRNESLEQTNLTRAFLGSFRYAAPEQLKGAMNLDGRADIYSLGIMLYEMLSQADPFGFSIKTRNISEASWIFAHTSEPPQSLRSQPGCEYLSPQLEAVVMRCLQKEPEDRFTSVEELNRALQAAVSSVPSGDLEQTIVQQHTQHIGDPEAETISRPLKITEQSQSGEPTIARTSSQETKREQTIAQHSFQPAKREQTIAQHSFQPAKREQTIAQHSQSSYREDVIEEPRDNPPKQQQQSSKLPVKLLPTLGIATLVVLGTIGGISAYSQFQMSQNLKEIGTLKTKENYEECMAKAEKVSQNSRIYPEVQVILNECRMKYAIQLANKYSCVEANAIAQKIPVNNPLYSATQENVRRICEL